MAIRLADNRWHIGCFRCKLCRKLLNPDANHLLLGDGSLICNSCTYDCSSCGNKVEDLAILTGDQAFCTTCFKCGKVFLTSQILHRKGRACPQCGACKVLFTKTGVSVSEAGDPA